VIIEFVVGKPTLVSNITIEPAVVQIESRPMRILDFDCEARPLSWISSDYVSKEITAIAWAWVGEDSPVECMTLSQRGNHLRMLNAFRKAYDQADMVTGHYIRGYDLPLINGMLFEYRLPPLSDKLAQDTKTDAVPRAGVSMSQESIGAMYRLEHPKVKMNQTAWRDANRLTREGVALTKERVIGDVIQHMAMRREMLESGWLNPPKVWRSTSELPAYVP